MNTTFARLTGIVLGILIVAGSLSLGADAVHAQEQAEEPSRYLVELVVFRHLDQSRTTPELQRPGALVMRSPADGISYAPARSESRQLNETARRIQNLQAYQLVRHMAWVQTAKDMNESVHANLGAMGLSPSQVSGSAKLYTRRYLHLDVQLELQATEAIINNSRRIRLNQIHYFDNPDFGVLALVTRAD